MKDLVIIGAGPVGLYSAYLAGEKELNFKIIEASDEVGGQLTKLYPEKKIYDIPGISEITASEYIYGLKKQINRIDISEENFIFNTKLTDIKKIDNHFELIFSNSEVITTRFVLLTSGTGELKPRELGLQKENALLNVKYSVKSKDYYTNKDVVIFGGGDSALDWANTLVENAKSVTLVHRRHEFRGKEQMVSTIIDKGVKLYRNYQYTNAEIINNTVKSITITENETSLTSSIKTDELLVFFGLLPSKVSFESIDIETKNSKIMVNQLSLSNQAGIYAAGDCVTYEGKVNSITCGNGEAFKAITAIKRHYKEK